MSVIVKGMEMPSCCSDCELNYDSLGCLAYRSDGAFDRPGFDMYTERLTNCPLRPLPEKHGRLKDVDAIIAELKGGDSESGVKASGADLVVAILLAYLDSRPTIMEAEGD